jgi:homoserine O-acetyltransferase
MTRISATFAALALLATPAAAYDGLVEKQTFELPSYATVGGEIIAPVRIGWESYGELNEAGDNAILVTHYFSGTSHAAGKYAETDAKPGYWDYLIGPGKPLDTDKFFVLSSDTLVNLNFHDPNVVTTGPASIDPETGQPYGLDFPIVTIRDFVEVQKALVGSLGITKLHAVMGASMGGLQALEWASAHPDMVERTVAVISAGAADPYLIGWLDAWAAPIRLDPNWQGGAYYGGAPPSAGLTDALRLVTLQALHWEWAAQFDRAPAEAGKDPAAALGNKFAIEAFLDAAAGGRAAVSDANHFLYLVKANQLFAAGQGGSVDEGLAAIESPVLLLPASDDLVFFPGLVEQTRALIAADGTAVDMTLLEGSLGHLDGVNSLGQVEEDLRAFLSD